MAKLTFGIDGPNMKFTVERNIDDADAPRILGYLASTEYGTVTVDGVERPAEPAECAAQFADGILLGLMAQATRHEEDVAAAAARAGVRKIEPI